MRDHELLQEFVQKASQDAFAQIVSMHIDAVYASARRQVRDPQLADDVTQAVFIVLAQKAKSLNPRFPLVGWLMKTTYFACRDVLKKEARRRKYEQEAAAMKSTVDESKLADELARIEPELDAALVKLNDVDRSAISLRYLQSQTIAEVGQALGISSEAAAKRIGRALDRLRRLLSRNGTAMTAVPLGTLLEQLPRAAAPSGLVHVAASVASSTATISNSVAGISRGVFEVLIWGKVKAAAAVVMSILIAAGAGVGTLSLVQAQNEASHAETARPPQSNPLSYVARLKNGVSVELIGLAEHPSSGQLWWHPDGNPMPKAPYHHPGKDVTPTGLSFNRGGPAMSAKEVAVRLNLKGDGLAEPVAARWKFDRFSQGDWWGNGEDAANNAVPGLSVVAGNVVDESKGTVFKIEIAASPWKSIVTTPVATGTKKADGDKNYEFQKPFETGGEAHVIFITSGFLRREDERLIAIDTAGQQHDVLLKTTRIANNIWTQEFFVKLPLASVKEISFQQRPFDQWIEFRNISAQFGAPTQVKVVTSDDALEPAPADTSRPRAVLKNGVSIEVLGISVHPSKGRAWWRADGSLMQTAPYEDARANIMSSDPGVITREIGVRLNRNIPGQAEPATIDWNIRNSKGTSGGGAPLDKAGQAIEGVESYALVLPDTPEEAILEARIGAGPWVTAGSIPAASGGKFPLGLFSYSFSPPREIAGKTHYDFTRSGIELSGVTSRIVAIDTQGRETMGQIIHMTGSLTSANGELVVPLPIHLIKELQFRQRALNQWVEIRNISLRPGVMTEVKVVTSDDPPEAK